ncbi:MAG: hydrogen gas-evolving membrane-bound hydrogenase subunit E [Bacillota bacterium]|nr:hydrogen gas-evolving membrane-bound hydrogenase subunit E [Bacillota bacterium]MDW7683106.1 hydrogen gas-evolving membrane-bound hydrogenase subunit E [Bacillota bacterium]
MKALFNVLIVLLLVLVGYMLLMTVSEIPPYGEMNTPANNYVSERYLEHGVEETGGHNLVANIVVYYRGYDTLVEITVLFTAVIGIFLAIKLDKPVSHDHDYPHLMQ